MFFCQDLSAGKRVQQDRFINKKSESQGILFIQFFENSDQLDSFTIGQEANFRPSSLLVLIMDTFDALFSRTDSRGD